VSKNVLLEEFIVCPQQVPVLQVTDFLIQAIALGNIDSDP
jgi:hypothetical protein